MLCGCGGSGGTNINGSSGKPIFWQSKDGHWIYLDPSLNSEQGGFASALELVPTKTLDGINWVSTSQAGGEQTAQDADLPADSPGLVVDPTLAAQSLQLAIWNAIARQIVYPALSATDQASWNSIVAGSTNPVADFAMAYQTWLNSSTGHGDDMMLSAIAAAEQTPEQVQPLQEVLAMAGVLAESDVDSMPLDLANKGNEIDLNGYTFAVSGGAIIISITDHAGSTTPLNKPIPVPQIFTDLVPPTG
jgi:hypothetical protein